MCAEAGLGIGTKLLREDGVGWYAFLLDELLYLWKVSAIAFLIESTIKYLRTTSSVFIALSLMKGRAIGGTRADAGRLYLFAILKQKVCKGISMDEE
jgi:hypothetical protein